MMTDPQGLWTYCSNNGGLKDNQGNYTGYTGTSGKWGNDPNTSTQPGGTIWEGGGWTISKIQNGRNLDGSDIIGGLRLFPNIGQPGRRSDQIWVHDPSGGSSRGCPVLPREAIDMIEDSPDKTFNVSPFC
jgi:hypothetical protein